MRREFDVALAWYAFSDMFCGIDDSKGKGEVGGEVVGCRSCHARS